MSARLARSAYASLRASARSRANYALPARRNMSVESHGVQPKKSDMPWAIGAAVVFGPLFLYLVSPSARKSQSQHAVHDDHHSFPTLGKEAPSSQEHTKEEAKAPEILKDDEGTPADVTATIALAEESDVPKDSKSPETVAETTTAAEQAPVGKESVTEKEPAAQKPAKETAATPETASAKPTSTETPTATKQTQA